MENVFSLLRELEQVDLELLPAEHFDLPVKETETLRHQ
jgi:hypothetical protein